MQKKLCMKLYPYAFIYKQVPKQLRNHKWREVQERGEGWGHGQRLHILSDLMSTFLWMFIVDFKRIRNMTIKAFLCVFFFNTRPNVTEGVRKDSPQRLRSLLQPKDFPANHDEPILESVHFFLKYMLIYHEEGWRIKVNQKIVANLPLLFFFFLLFFSFFVVTLPNTFWCIYFHCCP